MKNKIKQIYNKYGDFVFNCAVPHLMDLGARTLKQMDIEAQCQKLIANTPDRAIVSGEMQADILRCSAELEQLKMNGILRFVQTDMQFHGTKIHPSRVVCFVNKKTGARILNVVLPADTTDEEIAMICNRVDANRHEFHRFEPRTIVESVCRRQALSGIISTLTMKFPFEDTAMDHDKLKEALQKQEEYLFFWGRVEDIPVGDETLNELSRDIIAAYKDCRGTAYLGKLIFAWDDQKKLERGEIGIYTEYTGQSIPAYGFNFVIAQPDAQLEAMVIEWAIDKWPPKFELFTRILQRIKELDGLTLSWR